MEIPTPIIGLILNVVVQIAIFRSFDRFGLLRSVFLGFFLGLIVVLAISARVIYYDVRMPLKDAVPFVLMDLITYASLGYCYFHFINLGETARRIRILIELHDSHEGLTMDGILERYNAKEVLKKRINRLTNNRQLIYTDGKYGIGNPIMLFIANIIMMMKIILLGKRRTKLIGCLKGPEQRNN